MIFFPDQDMPDDLAHWLRHRGHAVTCLRDGLPVTTADAEVRPLLASADRQGLANNLNFA